jgi:hypothetical protein
MLHATRSTSNSPSWFLQGLPQTIQVTFSRDSLPSSLSVTFQGGFVGTQCAVQVRSTEGKWETKQSVYPEDVNRRQVFDLNLGDTPIRDMKLVFEQSSDFFGRITVYDLDILAKEHTPEQSP